MNETVMKYMPGGKVSGIKDSYADKEGYHIVLNNGWCGLGGKKSIVAKNVRDLRQEIKAIHKEKPDTNNPLAIERIKRGWRQADLAEKSGLTVRVIQKYESSPVHLNAASGINLYKLSQALGIQIKDLLTL